MLHHVGIEIRPDDVSRAVELFELLGFERVEPPPSLAEYTWLEHAGTQVHLMPSAQPAVPSQGHMALVVSDFEATVARVREHGFETRPGREHWGASRVHVTAPGGHRVELMAAPPDRQR